MLSRWQASTLPAHPAGTGEALAGLGPWGEAQGRAQLLQDTVLWPKVAVTRGQPGTWGSG